MTRIDAWVGRTLFVPLIIRLCQLTGMTQYAVSNYAWVAAGLTMVARLKFDNGWAIAWAVFVMAFVLIDVIIGGLFPNLSRGGSPFIRKFVLALLLIFGPLDALEWALGGHKPNPLIYAWNFFALLAEYAKTIKTIPPLEKRKSKALEARA
ncbi:hypothetical protein [Sphingomonas crocodyli]|uniref:Uncharacterized protein n=1 Tax=Sphingomonas crocodyli TaxID=1979270 RepID=A0A437M846_9SPHN|nr:hypothetical protein [Sphingomonas crocodyli]RVT93736.1 hypothetical protein EOD43_07675 [Sphingomonas crocodyli]